MKYYTMIFDVRDSALFSKEMASPYLETMKSGDGLLNGARLVGVSRRNAFHERDDYEGYIEYLSSYIDSSVKNMITQWTYYEWEKNGKPDEFIEEDHTDESYREAT